MRPHWALACGLSTTLRCGIAIAATPAPQPSSESAPPTSAAGPEPPREPPPPSEPELDILTFHRLNYFLTGFNRRTQALFQFSIKYDLWPSRGYHTVYLAYTQRSLWDWYDRSAPFRESNYAPEIFYAHYHSERHGEPSLGCAPFDEQLGVEHQSNGTGGSASRSWNRVFTEAEADCRGEHVYGSVALRLWLPFLTQENPNITRTQGYGELRGSVGIDRLDLHLNGIVSVALRKGTSRLLRKGSVVVDARWRPTYARLLGKAWKFAPFVWLQLFTGYGETLGTYDHATTSLRLGIGLTDRAQ